MYMRLIALIIVLWGSVAFAQSATQTPTRTPTQTPSPTLTWTPDTRHRATLFWYLSPFSDVQPVRTWSNQGTSSFGVYAPAPGRLQDMQVLCNQMIVASAQVSITINGVPTSLSCNYQNHTGCRDLFSITGNTVNFSTGDYLNVAWAAASGEKCELAVGLMNQDGSEFPSTTIFGQVGNVSAHATTYCIPDSLSGDSRCAGIVPANGFIVPRAANVLIYDRNGQPCGGFCTNQTYTVHNQTTATDYFTATLTNTQSVTVGTCPGACTVAAGDQLNVRVDTTNDGLGWDAETHWLEIAGTGQIVTARYSQWSAAVSKYINQHTIWDSTIANSLICSERGAVGQNLRAQLNGAAPNDVTVTLCVGPDPGSVVCNATEPQCMIPAGQLTCSDETTQVVIPTGYVYTVQGTVPGQDIGTLGVSFELAPPATPIALVGGCGFATPSIPAPETPTDTPTPEATVTGTIAVATATVTAAKHCASFTPTPILTSTPTPTTAPAERRHNRPWVFE